MYFLYLVHIIIYNKHKSHTGVIMQLIHKNKFSPLLKSALLSISTILLLLNSNTANAIQVKITDPLYIPDQHDFRAMHRLESNYRKFDKLQSGNIKLADSKEVGFSMKNFFTYGITDYFSATLDIDRVIENRVKNKNGTLGNFTTSEVGWENPILGVRYRFWDDGSGYVIDFGAKYEPDWLSSSRPSQMRDGRPGEGYDRFTIFMKDGIVLGKNTLSGFLRARYNLGDHITDYYNNTKWDLGNYWDFDFSFEWQHRYTDHFSLNGDIGYHYFGSRNERNTITGEKFRIHEPDQIYLGFNPTYEVLPHSLSAGAYYKYIHFKNKRIRSKTTNIRTKEDNKYAHEIGISVCYEFIIPIGDDKTY